MTHLIDIDTLNDTQKIELAEYLWDSVNVKKNDSEIPAGHKTLLDDLILEPETHIGNLKTWEEVKKGILKRRK